MPPDFVFPYPGMLGPSGFTRVTSVDLWLPITFSGPMAATNRMLTPAGRSSAAPIGGARSAA